MLFSSRTYYIRITKWLLEIRNVDTDARLSKKVSEDFSNDRMLLADFDSFKNQLRDLVEEFEGKHLFLPQRTIIFHPIEDSISEFSSVEKRSFRDACEYAGAKEIYMVFGEQDLSNSQIRAGIKGVFER